MGVAVLIVCIIILVVWMKRQGRSRKGLPPGPAALPVIGNLLHIMKGEHPQRVFARLAERYGPVAYLRLGLRDAVVVSSAAMAREFLQAHDKVFASRPPFEVSRRVLYGQDSGLALTRYGPHWRAIRRLCTTHLFTPKKFLEFRPIREDETRLFLQRIRRSSQGSPGSDVDLSRSIAVLSEDMTGRMLFSKRLTEVVDPSSGISLQGLTQRGGILLQKPVIGDLIPWLGFLDWRVKRAMDELHASYESVLEGLLRDREAELAAPPETRSSRPADFLDELISNCDTRNQIKTTLVELIGGAVDTTGAAIQWAMTELLSKPKVLQQLQDELDNVVGRERLVKETDLGENTPYLRAVVKETLRLHPPTPLLLPHCSTEISHVAGYVLPKETRVFVNAWAIGRDPKTWESAEEFKPERFLADALNNQGLRQLVDVRGQDFELIPFGSGRRICPGMSVGMATVELILASLVHSFDWKISPLHGLDKLEKSGTVLTRANPLILIPSPRFLF